LAELPEATMMKTVQNLIRTLPASVSVLLGAKISLLKKTALSTLRKPRMQISPLGLRMHGVSRIKRPLIKRKEKE
jgi:hypothetical protein